MNAVGSLGTCGCLIAVGYTGCNHVSAVTFCVLAVGFIGFQQCGPIISHLDIASNYAGTLVGITNSLAAIPGFIGPFVVGAITNGNVIKSFYSFCICLVTDNCIVKLILANSRSMA